MKKFAFLFALSAVCVFISPGCNKGSPFIPDAPHLTSVQIKSDRDTTRYDYEYDGSGRVSRILTTQNNQPRTTFYDIRYNGNEIILTQSGLSTPDHNLRDTIHLFTDGNNQVLKRIKKQFSEYTGPNHNPQRSWHYDTTTYEYNADGLLMKSIRSSYDTTWYNPGSPRTTVVRSLATTTHTINDGNLVQTKEITNIAQVERTTTDVFFDNRSTELTKNFRYNLSYLNKTDFSNAAVLSEVNWFSQIPFNKKYRNLPNHIDVVLILKDQNGSVNGSLSTQFSYQYTYNANGFIDSRDQLGPFEKVTYEYEK